MVTPLATPDKPAAAGPHASPPARSAPAVRLAQCLPGDARDARGAHDARDARGAHDARDARGAHDARDARGAHDARDARGPGMRDWRMTQDESGIRRDYVR